MSWPLHGSNPQYIYQFLQLPKPEKIIDFSVNINPFGPPPVIRKKWPEWHAAIADYPDPYGKDLVGMVVEKEQLPSSSILLGNGGAELIALVARFFAGKRVLLIQPTFSEYERMCHAYGCEMTNFTLTEGDWRLSVAEVEPLLKTHDVMFLCNPNNPTGILYSEAELINLIKACEKHQCYLVVDEAFYDFVEKPVTIAPRCETHPHLMVIRSLTKMYAIAGLRLGYMLADTRVIEQLKGYQAHWNMNALALLAGQECLKAHEYVTYTKNDITTERNRVTGELSKMGYIISDSEVNFYLLRDPERNDQLPLFQFLLKKGIVPRHTANYEGLEGRWMRFAVRTQKENDFLLEALREWKEN